MTDRTDQTAQTPANENENPLRFADTALTEFYRLRRELLAKDMSRGYTLRQWRERNEALRGLERGIALCLAHL